MPRQKSDPYFIEAAAKAIDLLALFGENDELRLADVMSSMGFIKSTAFRFLYTLEKKGCIERVPGSHSYRRARGQRVGFISISRAIPFVEEVEQSIASEAEKAGIDLLVRHHEFDGSLLRRHVQELLAQGIRLLLCYNPDEHLSHVVADRCAEAGVPVVAITFPVPGARVFGVNNYRAGLAGGEGLGEYIVWKWSGKLDGVIVLDIPGSSPAQQARVTGMVEGLRNKVSFAARQVLHLHPDRGRRAAECTMEKVLGKHKAAQHVAVLCYNDVNALGAADAVRKLRRTENVLILSQGGVAEVRGQIRKARSPLWGAVAHFPERFGEKLIPLAQKVLRGETAPPATYTEHILLTRKNIGQYYADSQ